MAEPAVRANWSKQALRLFRKLPAAKRDQLLAEIGPASVEQIRSAGILSWLPMEHQARIFDAVHKVLGEAAAIEFWADLMFANFDAPLLRPLVEGGMRLFGATPHSIIRMSPRAWSLVTRGCGTHIATRGEGAVDSRLAIVGLPRRLNTPGFIAHCIGNCNAVLRFLRMRGRVRILDENLGGFTIEVSDVHD